LLVDKRLVSCSLCQRKTFTGWLKKFCNAGFLGHYILLWGYSPEKDIFLYSDPASSQGMWITEVFGVDINAFQNIVR